jgi:hypothetical protein
MVAGKAASYEVAPLITAIAYSRMARSWRFPAIAKSCSIGRTAPGLSPVCWVFPIECSRLYFHLTGSCWQRWVAHRRVGESQIWDAASHELKRSVTFSSDTLFGASFSPDGSDWRLVALITRFVSLR